MERLPVSSRRATLAIALLSALSLGACVGGTVPDPTVGAREDSDVRVTVQNNDFNDAVIYANWAGGPRLRIGMVTGKTSATFTVPWRARAVQLEASFIAGGTFKVDEIEVWEGDHLDFVILAQG